MKHRIRKHQFVWNISMARFRKNALRSNSLVHKESLKHHFQDYCASTSIHGVKYLGDPSRPSSERIWWVTMLACCMIGNGYLISKVWIKWHDSPVIVSFAETAMPIWEVPFPAITFCSEIKSRVDVFNFTDAILKYQNGSIAQSDEEMKRMGDLTLLCDKHVLVENGQKVTDNSTLEFLDEMIPEVDDTTIVCQFADSTPTNCSEYFSRIFTDEGVCYSFNMLAAPELFRGYGNPMFLDHGLASSWSLEAGYDRDAPLQTTYPRRVISAGASTSFNLVVKYRVRDTDFHCRGPVQGFKILLHNPGEFPLVTERHLRIPLSQEIIAMVQPKVMTTSDGLRPYSPQIRQCFFPSERYLAHFRIYTQRNCEVECLTNFTLARCGCVNLYMPRNETTPLCGAGSKQCMVDAENELKLVEIEAARNADVNSKCNCLQACQSINFDAETSQADYDTIKTLLSYGDNLTELAGHEGARVRIFFKDMQFSTSRRSELFGLVDFLANCGGLLGLFCGISILSFCEIVYYITLRFWANLHLIKKKHESMDIDDGVDNTITVYPQPQPQSIIEELKEC
ncbi:Amiloride-sensitive sodium channel [Nesidiocoris tenuis]|uniref:Amiloride-sensitive sodium channel n=1 Tax=Nesidiocoris tenuis TaxID=355587 RepID=A0ABN7A9K2_9HEMI|nr:Amiloride-sensitive sodium channel [Nesidiocoris tenuis]